MSWQNAIGRALDEREISNADAARELGVSAEAVRLWRCGARLPAGRHIAGLCRLAGLKRHEVRPDLYESPAAAPAEQGAA